MSTYLVFAHICGQPSSCGFFVIGRGLNRDPRYSTREEAEAAGRSLSDNWDRVYVGASGSNFAREPITWVRGETTTAARRQ